MTLSITFLEVSDERKRRAYAPWKSGYDL
jgi:hypothetical protein